MDEFRRLAKLKFKNDDGAFDEREIPEIVQLWMLRILVRLKGHSRFLSVHGVDDERIAEAIGLGKCVDDSGHYSFQKALTDLKDLHLEAEENYQSVSVQEPLAGNIVRMGSLVGLSEIDQEILQFAVIIYTEPLLDSTGDLLGDLSSSSLWRTLSIILGIPAEEVQKSLSSEGVLSRSGLLTLDHSPRLLKNKLDLLSRNFADRMDSCSEEPIDLLRGTISATSKAHMTLEDYHHVDESLSILIPYLKRSVEDSRRGVNIFLYGPPGTGKSQLARALAATLGRELYQVDSEDRDGDPIKGECRLKAYKAAQWIFSSQKAFILFDEVEDVFADGIELFGMKSTAQVRKAWMNRMLEENPLPCFWLSNSIDCLDKAFIRRFDMVIELEVPPRSQRAGIIKMSCGDLVSDSLVEKISESDSLSPAVITRAASVVTIIRNDLPQGRTGEAFEHLVNSSLLAQGYPGVKKLDPTRLPDHYDPSYLNASEDLTLLAEGIKRTRSGRICLYGPPGTGKTAYAKWLAEQLDIPLHTQRGSDLISKYVGETESNIARVFREAEREGALLLLDEVDSFLQDRRKAQRSWEVTEVNEMLTQMESFSGIFIASTNLMEDLDQASLRRFDIKISFGYLKPDQVWRLSVRTCEVLGIGSPSEDLYEELRSLRIVTPGDFAAIGRKHKLRPLRDSLGLLDVLRNECLIKNVYRKQVFGFS